jgi:hypothetical protein
MRTKAGLYEQDFYAWTQEQAALLREGAVEELDLTNLAEELESMGRSEKRALESDLEVLLVHLLKWQHQPDYREESHSWLDTIVEHRSRIGRLLRDNPSLRPQVPALVAEVYPTARTRALIAMAPSQLPMVEQGAVRLPSNKLLLREMTRRLPLPTTCPWTPAQVLDADFWPDTP